MSVTPHPQPSLPAIRGVHLATTRAGFYSQDRDDVLAVRFPQGAQAAGVFTCSATRSADVDWCRNALRKGGGRACALVVNAGNSNAWTGDAGIRKNAATVQTVASLQSCSPETVFVSATGVIGQPVPPRMVADTLPGIWDMPDSPDWDAAARAIMTTDTRPKTVATGARIGSASCTVVGIAKGSGMIAPNMATMLAYLFTDAPLSAPVCQALIERHCTTSFNAITIDSDTSTSDTLMLFATGEPLYTDPHHPDIAEFSAALADAMQQLAIQIVRDGEGATALIEISVTGAVSDSSAHTIAMSIANSPLVKTAMAARDANWGRILAAAGKAGQPVERAACILRIGQTEIARCGGVSPLWTEEAATAALRSDPICVHLDVGCGGPGSARVWTCDLTAEYVAINSSYRN